MFANALLGGGNGNKTFNGTELLILIYSPLFFFKSILKITWKRQEIQISQQFQADSSLYKEYMSPLVLMNNERLLPIDVLMQY